MKKELLDKVDKMNRNPIVKVYFKFFLIFI